MTLSTQYIIVLLLLFSVSSAQEKQTTQTAKTTKIEQTTPANKSADSAKFCKNLKKVNNMEELLYQFYSHFDNDCLLHTPSKVLEKAWGIKIFDIRGSISNSSLFAELQYYDDTPTKGFNYDVYIVRHNRSIAKPPDEYFIISSRLDYLNEQKTLLPNNRFPKSLPKPIYSAKYCHWICKLTHYNPDSEPLNIPRGDLRPWLPTDLQGGYGWKKNDYTLSFSTDSSYQVNEFTIRLQLKTGKGKEEQSFHSNKAVTLSESCKNLKKVNNMEELLYQFYSHFDNDCLLHTPSEVLEKAWGIKIFDIRGSNDDRPFWDAYEDYYADIPKKSFKYDTYIVRHNQNTAKPPNEYFIITSRADYLKEQKTLLPNNRFPKSLPKPIYSRQYCEWICSLPYLGKEKLNIPRGDLHPWKPSASAGGYGWKKNGHSLYFATDSSYSVSKFTVKLKPHTN